MSGKKSTLRAAHQKKKQLRKPKAIASQESTLRKHQQKIQERATKKKKRDDEEEDDEEDSGSDDEESADELLLTKETEGEKTQFNFEFSDMKEEFYGGIQLMLAKQLYSTGAAHDITEIIIKQDELGTVVHCEGETDVFAYASILPATKLASVEFMRQLANYIDHHAQAAANQECKNVLNSIAAQDANASKYGLLFHDRYVNFPLELINELHRNLSDDLSWILDPSQRNSEITDDLVQSFEQMEHIVLFRPVAPESDSSSSTSSSSDSDLKVQNVTGSNSIMFDYFEDDVYFEQAEHAWKLKLDPKLFKYSNYVMMLIPKQNIARVAASLQRMLAQ